MCTVGSGLAVTLKQCGLWHSPNQYVHFGILFGDWLPWDQNNFAFTLMRDFESLKIRRAKAPGWCDHHLAEPAENSQSVYIDMFLGLPRFRMTPFMLHASLGAFSALSRTLETKNEVEKTIRHRLRLKFTLFESGISNQKSTHVPAQHIKCFQTNGFIFIQTICIYIYIYTHT